jgi:putative ABC transport system substrate-binding protein
MSRGAGTRGAAGIRARFRARALLGAALALALACAGAPARAGDIALIKGRDLEPYNRLVAGFRLELPSGWQEYDLQADDASLEFVARALRRQAPGVVVAVGPRAAALVQKALPRVPAVYALAEHPERLGASARSAAWTPAQAGPGEVLRLMRAVAPRGTVLGMVVSDPPGDRCRAGFESAAAAQGVDLKVREAHGDAAVSEAFRSLVPDVDAVWFAPDPVSASPASFELARRLCAERKVPLLVFSEALARAGALASVSPDYEALGRQTARLAQRALGGQAGGGEQPMDASAVVYTLNLRAAAELGLTLSRTALAQAQKLIR